MRVHELFSLVTLLKGIDSGSVIRTGPGTSFFSTPGLNYCSESTSGSNPKELVSWSPRKTRPRATQDWQRCRILPLPTEESLV